MNKIFGLLVFGTMVGCGVDELQVGVETSALIKCPDPEDCVLTNGSGTYVEENGYAGIGPNAYMITRFVNNPGSPGVLPSVSIEGRYSPLGTTDVLTGPGVINFAIYNNQHWDAVSVSESLTEPTWVLHNAASGSVSVIGPDIVNMKLVVALRDGTTNEAYTVAFTDHVTENGNTVMGTTVTAQKINMQWKVAFTADAFKQYCFRGPNPNPSGPMAHDRVVFQQGIIMNGFNANIVRDDAYVTLSCRHGAPATAWLWGYTYRSNGVNQAQTNLFDAALHMKRASYCGDASFYTYNGTDILIQDHFHIVDDSMDSGSVEAVWGPSGAVCVNDQWHRRHRNALYDGAVFQNSDCPPIGLPALPDCVTWAQTHTANSGLGMLADLADPAAP